MDIVKALSDDATVTPAVATCIAELWQHPHVQRAYGERNKFQLNDSAKFFFDKVHDIARPDYLPTVEDIVKTRVRTTGILEESYKVDGVDFVVYDVGGQRNERRKWIHAFDDVRAGERGRHPPGLIPVHRLAPLAGCCHHLRGFAL